MMEKRKVLFLFILFSALELGCCNISRKPISDQPTPECLQPFSETVRDICNKTSNYPMKEIASLLKESPLKVMCNSLIKNIAPIQTLATKSTKEPACLSRTVVITPKAAKTLQGDWVYVVNVDSCQQFFWGEVCESETCSSKIGLPNGYNNVCEQKYVIAKALTFSSSRLQTSDVFIPSCCACYLISSF
ncbi:protein spaetzle 5-like [Limulus polyphemus]|uniref:Protein spaetzle 5-like n=1 Tax=Limulus polyphemus TaxID=6850 RepID=A0ABM1TCT6_LIMPO|nr:protein spaetzle 5-like [Limulus polyphemus]